MSSQVRIELLLPLEFEKIKNSERNDVNRHPS